MTASEGSWADYYRDGAALASFFAALHYHEPLLSEILAGAPASALEAGSGPANMSSFLAMAGVDAIAVDNDPGVLEVARESARRWRVQPTFLEADIFHLDKLGRTVDVVFSQGVLEHFQDDEIRELTRQSLAIAPRFVFSVPSKWYGHRDFGNERLFTAERWAELLAGLGRVTVTPYFYARRRSTYALRKPLMVLATVEREGS
jgi:SAM-dependent methyltransferase